MRVSLALRQPRPIFLVDLDEEESTRRVDWIAMAKAVEETDSGLTWVDLAGAAFRGVAFGRLEQVLTTGIDVQPPDRPFYVSEFEKALEYGDWPKVMLALDYDSLDRPWRRVREGMSPEEVASIRKTFPNEVRDARGGLWLTNVRREGLESSFQYDIDYGRWIPGSAWDALRAVIVLTRPGAETKEGFGAEVARLARLAPRQADP
jgi:hypothetical protein